MKYLKLFESTQLYYEVSRYEASDLVHDSNTIQMSDSDILIITEYIKNLNLDFQLMKHRKYYYSHNDEGSLFIYSLLDEWYLATIHFSDGLHRGSVNYKCDQMDGLLACLKEVLS